jgi:hypothetical protein
MGGDERRGRRVITGQETEGKALLTQSKKNFMRKLQLEV